MFLIDFIMPINVSLSFLCMGDVLSGLLLVDACVALVLAVCLFEYCSLIVF
ncbi:hypothetical protein Vdis_1137 [Vulcanisaeta distributa DSM 14429]|uniref:Uncharacterized protein n=1 Tax=Vulcanisaeta distributa (strain DSM 14429 / JCM 11212 / NBRC 100878 / IC-017) TaxID=572478 RepID=E1QQV5_VULDI|nr:hypothetical protein Vdis_1137 [Vulcanisaeta distributa DSM 14429]